MRSDDVAEETAEPGNRMDHRGAHHHPVHPVQCHGGGAHPEHLPRQVHQHDGQPGRGREADGRVHPGHDHPVRRALRRGDADHGAAL